MVKFLACRARSSGFEPGSRKFDSISVIEYLLPPSRDMSDLKIVILKTTLPTEVPSLHSRKTADGILLF